MYLSLACRYTFAQAPDSGLRESMLSWHIRQGHFGHLNLDDLSFVRVARWEGDPRAEKANGAAGSFVDARRRAPGGILPRIFGGQVGGFPAFVAGMFTKGRQIRGVERARISFEIAPGRAHWFTEIAGKVRSLGPGPDRRACEGNICG